MSHELRLSLPRLVALAAAWAALGGGGLIVSSCYGRNCEGAQSTYGIDAGQGEMVDENTWESSPQLSTWLPFPRQSSYVFTIPFGGRTPVTVDGYVSAQPNPNESGQCTHGAGNLTEFTSTSADRAIAINDTCSDYYVRVVARAAAFGPLDGGGGAPAGQQ